MRRAACLKMQPAQTLIAQGWLLCSFGRQSTIAADRYDHGPDARAARLMHRRSGRRIMRRSILVHRLRLDMPAVNVSGISHCE